RGLTQPIDQGLGALLLIPRPLRIVDALEGGRQPVVQGLDLALGLTRLQLDDPLARVIDLGVRPDGRGLPPRRSEVRSDRKCRVYGGQRMTACGALSSGSVWELRALCPIAQPASASVIRA